MESGRILGIAYNVIPVKDVEKSAAWFVKHFGFNIRNKRDGYLSLFRENRPILDLIQSEHESRAVFEVNGRKRWVITFFCGRYLVAAQPVTGRGRQGWRSKRRREVRKVFRTRGFGR